MTTKIKIKNVITRVTHEPDTGHGHLRLALGRRRKQSLAKIYWI